MRSCLILMSCPMCGVSLVVSSEELLLRYVILKKSGPTTTSVHASTNPPTNSPSHPTHILSLKNPKP